MNMTNEGKEMMAQAAIDDFSSRSTAKLEQAASGFDGWWKKDGIELATFAEKSATKKGYQAGAASQQPKIAELTEEVERFKGELFTKTQCLDESRKQLQSAQLAYKTLSDKAESVCKSLEHHTESVNVLQMWELRDALSAPLDTSAADELLTKAKAWDALLIEWPGGIEEIESAMRTSKQRMEQIADWERRSESCESKLGQLEANEKVVELLELVKNQHDVVIGAMCAIEGRCLSGEYYEQLTAARSALEEAREVLQKAENGEIPWYKGVYDACATITRALGEEQKKEGDADAEINPSKSALMATFFGPCCGNENRPNFGACVNCGSPAQGGKK